MRTALCAAVLLLSCAVAGASAQAPVPDAPPGLADKRNSAAKLAGLAGFVNMSCDAIRTDTDRLKSAVEALGVQMRELEQGELRLRAQSYIDAYRQDPAASCQRADAFFGRTGTVVPGLFVTR